MVQALLTTAGVGNSKSAEIIATFGPELLAGAEPIRPLEAAA